MFFRNRYKVKTGSVVCRRRALLAGGISALIATAGLTRAIAGALSSQLQTAQVSIENFSVAGKSLGVVHLSKLIKSDAEWAHLLSAIANEVTRHEGTERPYSGTYWNNHAEGLYRCICCDTALFDSTTKFESGTGWPSFWQPISALNIIKNTDTTFGMQRDAISCQLCDAHLGHVFNDGPNPTGLRYCMNSAALNFTDKT